jgi:hypothetical protein
MCKEYIAEIQSYTQCHENRQQLFQALKRAFADLKRRITATQRRFDLNFEAEQDDDVEEFSNDELVLDLGEPQLTSQGKSSFDWSNVKIPSRSLS